MRRATTNPAVESAAGGSPMKRSSTISSGAAAAPRRNTTGVDGSSPPRKGSAKAASCTTTPLAFAGASLDDVERAILKEDPSHEFNKGMWAKILMAEETVHLMPIKDRTLHFWVGGFNKWQALVRKQKLKTSELSGVQLRECLPITDPTLLGIVKTFDATVAHHERTLMMQKAKLPMLELLSAGVIMSKLIPKAVKLRFLLSLVDLNDSGTLDEKQLAMLLWAFTLGLARSHGVEEKELPSKASTKQVAERLYKRIGGMAGGAMEGSPEGQLPYSVLEDWMCGTLSDVDPLALPYRLAIDRFSQRHTDEECILEAQCKDFFLSHSRHVSLPEVPKMPLPSRQLINASYIVFKKAKSERFTLSLSELDEILEEQGVELQEDDHVTLIATVDKLKQTNAPAQDLHFIDFLHKQYPKAHPTYLRTFCNWIHDAYKAERVEAEVENLEEALEAFKQNQAKPILPQERMQRLLFQFKEIDRDNSGYITMSELCAAWGVSVEDANAAFNCTDELGDGHVDKNDFLRLVCPAEYRLPEMSGKMRDCFGQILTEAIEEREHLVHELHGEEDNETHAPLAVLPPAPDSLLEEWSDIFDGLDLNHDETVDVKEMEASGLLSTAVCYAIAGILDPEDKNGFSKDAFIGMMCKVNGYRPADVHQAREMRTRTLTRQATSRLSIASMDSIGALLRWGSQLSLGEEF